MYKVTYDFVSSQGVLETGSVFFKELKEAFSWIRKVSNQNILIGKPILERI